MSILNEKSRKVLVESMRSCVCDILQESATLTAKQASDHSKFISESATYEQLLNITMNPDRETKYLPSHVLEGAVAILHSACMTGRRKIGVNAITEGAIKLHKQTGAVITESMLDAALASVERGSGLKVIGKILQEDFGLDQIQNMINSVGGYKNLPPETKIAIGQDLSAKYGPSNAEKVLQQFNNGDVTGGSARNILRVQKAQKSMQNRINELQSNLKQMSKGSSGYKSAQFELRALQQKLQNSVKHGIKAPVRSTTQGMTAGMKSIVDRANNSGGNWRKYALGAAAAGAATLGGMYLWNKRKQNLQDQQDAYQQ
jgi:hypothetical protein